MEPLTLVRTDAIQDNLRTLLEYAGSDSGDDLRSRYYGFLNSVQRCQVRTELHLGQPLVDFNLDHPATRALIDILRQSPEFKGTDRIEPVPQALRDGVSRLLQLARGRVAQYSAELVAAFDLLVAWLVLVDAPECAGGSFWHVLGAVWMSPRPDWEVLEYSENLVHETVHQTMFVEDMVNSLFSAPPSALAGSDALITSSIRGVKRPFDHAFHAATVSAELIRFHEIAGSRARASELCVPLLATLVELQSRREYLSSRGAEVLDTLNGMCSESETLRRMQVSLNLVR